MPLFSFSIRAFTPSQWELVGTDREQPGREDRKMQESQERRRKEKGSIFQKVPRPCLHSGPAYIPVGGVLDSRPLLALAGPHPQDPSGVPGPYLLELRGCLPALRHDLGAPVPRGERVAESAWELRWQWRGRRSGRGCTMRCATPQPKDARQGRLLLGSS